LTKSVLALVVMFAFMATTASAQTIFVSASSGIDTFDGTSPNVQSGLVGPKRTIAAAIAEAGAGGTISIEAGTYAEDVTVTTDLTILTTASGGNTTVTIGTGGGNALVLGNDANDDINITAGGANITTTGVEGIVFQHGNIAISSGALTVPAGAPVTVTDAKISGSAPTYSGTSAFTYNGTTTTARTVGVEFPATVGLLTISTTEPITFPGGFAAAGITHTSVASGDATFQGNVTSSAQVTTTGAGDMTFSGTLTSTQAAANAVNVGDGLFTAANVNLDDLGGLVVAAGETASISGQLLLQSDVDNGDFTRIDNNGTLTVGSVVLQNIDTTVGVASGTNTDIHTIANDGTLNITSVSEDLDSSTTAGAAATDRISAIFALTNNTGTSRTTFSNAVTISGTVQNAIAAPNGVYFNGGGTLNGDVNNAGGFVIGTGGTLELTSDIAAFTQVGDINGSGTLLISGDANIPGTGLDADGNVTMTGNTNNAGTTVVDGVLTVNGRTAGPDFTGAVTVGGDLVVASEGSDFAAGVTVGGNATLDADANGGDGPDFAGILNVTGNLTVTDDTDVAGALTAANVTVNSNEALNLTGAGLNHNVSGTLNVNGTSSVVVTAAAGSTLTVDVTVIDQNALIDLNAGNTYVAQGNFTGGMFDGTGAGATLRVELPASGASFSPGPNTQVNDFRVQGNERTLTLLQSFEVQNDFFVADDATMSLTNRLVRMTGVADGTGLVEIATDAQITATDISGAISFEGAAGALFTISSDVGGQDVGTLTNLVISSTAVGPANKVSVDEDVTITGVINLVEGGLTILGGDTMTFTGASAGISRNVGGNNTTITGTTAGIYDLTYTGVGPAANGAEFVDPGTNVIDDLTVNVTGGAMTLNPAVGINGNFTVGSASIATIVGGLTVGGNMTVNAVTATDGTVNGAGTVTLGGAGATHTVNGTVLAPVVFAANATVNGNSSNNVESNISNATVNTGTTVTIAGLQEILGDLTVNGTLTLGLTDADGAGADDQDVEGDVFVDEAGSLTLTSNVSVAGGGLAATGFAVGNGGAGSAALDLGGNTLTLSAGTSSFTADADATIGATGTIRVAAATTIGSDNTASGTARAMLPNVNIDAVGASLSSDIGVNGTLDFDEDFTIGTFDIWLAGDATFVDTAGNAQLDIIGTTGRFITLGTTLTMAEDVSVPNFQLSSTGTTTLAENGAAASYDFFVDNNGAGTGEAEFNTGTLDLGGQDFVVRDTDGADESLIDYNGGTITGSGRFVVMDDNDGNGGIDTDTASEMAFVNLRVQVGAADAVAGDANDGLDMSASDVISVSGTLELDGGTIFIDNGATNDGTFTIADNARIIRDFGVFDATAGTVSPTFGGNAITVEYDDAVTTGRELPGTVAELQLDAAITMADDADLTLTTLDINAAGSNLDVDADNGTVWTITDGGVVQLAHGAAAPFTAGAGAAGSDDGEISYAGAYSILVDGSSTSSAQVWQGSPSDVTVSGAGAVTLTMGGNASAGNVTVGAGETLAMGTRTLTLTGNLTQNGAVTATTGTLAFAGTTAQSFTLPAGGNTLPNVTFNNPMGVDVTGGNLNVSTLATFTQGNVRTGTNALVLNHASTGAQGFTQTSGGVVGNVRKFIIGGALGAPADRMTFPTAASDGTARPVAITFNQPNQIGAAAVAGGVGANPAGFNTNTGISLTVNHMETSPGGNNNLPLTTVDNLANDLTIARYPDFHWLITSSSTLSPSVDYDIELNAAGYAAFSGEDIERTRTIRRQGGATTNFWFLVGGGVAANNDNFANSATNPVTVVRNAVGALNSGNGVLFTMGLESNMAVTNPAAVSVNNGASATVDLSTVFSGGTGAYTYAVTSGDAAIATGAAAGNTLTITGTGAGATTVTVVATDALNDTRTATVAVTVNPALAAGSISAVALNAGGTSTVDLSTVFTGGASPVTYAVTSSDAAAATGAEASGTLTITGVAAGSATITVTATDATSQTATATVAVTVNAAMSATNPATVTLTEGASSDIDLSTVFAGGDGTYSYTVSSAATNVTAAVATGTLTVTAAEAYAAGTTIGTVDVTVTATDGIGSSVSATVTVDVLPVLGDLDGSGAPSAASASIALDYFLGLTTLTAKQQVAADFNGDGSVNAFDAALIFNAFLNGKDELTPNVAANLQFGTIEHAEGMINIPLQIAGDLNDVVAASFMADIDPAKAKVVAVTSELDSEWIVKHTVSEEGQVRIAVAGLGTIPTEGTIATISVQLTDAGAAFDLVADGSVNNNALSALDAVEVVELPDSFTLQGNYPNPFNPTTTIQFDLPQSADVEVQVYDMVGRQVMTLPAQNIAAGSNRSVQLNASQLASGSYFYRVIARMESKTFVETGRMLLLK